MFPCKMLAPLVILNLIAALMNTKAMKIEKKSFLEQKAGGVQRQKLVTTTNLDDNECLGGSAS
jgi:hypothetical protein